jgi:hypothetical protein
MAKPVAVIAAFGAGALPRILDTIASGPQPPAADWFVGTYGINREASELIRATPGCRYAPVFGIQPHTSAAARRGRELSRARALLVDRSRAGPIPGNDVVPPVEQRAWGVELGRRFRDQLRANRDKGIEIDAWQFDEVISQVVSDARSRAFVGGILRGLAQGRRKLGDRLEQGLVWTAGLAVSGLPGLAVTADVPHFWSDLDRAALFLVGEEYPFFQGDPQGVGGAQAAGQRGFLTSAGSIRRALGKRYVVGMTPGWIDSDGLRGNVDHKPLGFVRTWRRGFVQGRTAGQAPRGFGQFNFVHDNALPARVKEAVTALHEAAERLS